MNEISELIKGHTLKPIADAYDPKKEITVSVFCLTYNQEKYIKDALDSFLNQLVDFNVEIVVHDDASTDNTPAILKEYSAKYPNVVKVFFEKENQYSRVGDTIEVERIHIKNAHGKYISSCEGDDYWIDPYKLFLQLNALENNPNCHFSTHRVKVENLLDSTKNEILPHIAKDSGVIPQEEFVDLVNDDYPFQTSCYFMERKLYEKFLLEPPLYSQIMPTSDEAVMYYFGNIGDVYFVDRVMSCWRKFTENSWNVTNLINADSKAQNERRRRFARGIDEYFRYSGERFLSCLERRNRLLVTTYISESNLKEIFNDKRLRKTLKKQGIRRYWKFRIKCFLGKGV